MPDARFRDVALFLMICAVWLITDSSAIQTYSSHPDMLCTISFYMFMLHSVPMLHFAQKIGGLKKERILDAGIAAVSYTHLDVYKRQEYDTVCNFPSA